MPRTSRGPTVSAWSRQSLAAGGEQDDQGWALVQGCFGHDAARQGLGMLRGMAGEELAAARDEK